MRKQVQWIIFTKMQAHARVCEENTLEEKVTPIETI